MWAELGPAPKKIKKIESKKIESVEIKILHVLEKIYFLSIYSLISGLGIGKNIY
jgi:hypothetical protein